MSDLQHLAIIMDGNGRWAKEKNMPRSYGHLKGSENVRNIAISAYKLGIKVLTLYAFSTENWKRSTDEINYLMDLPEKFFNKYIDELNERGFKVETIGDLSRLPKSTVESINRAIEITKNNSNLTIVFAINYGSKDEIVRGINNYVSDLKNNKVNQEMTTELFDKYLYTCKYPPIDLMIRTSLDYRLSNFLLWQLAYSEFIFIDKYWPEFTEDDLKNCVEQFNHRDRRFGGTNND